MRPSSLGGGRIYCVALCLSVRLSVHLSVRPVIVFVYFTVEQSYERTSKIEKLVFAYGPASRMYFSARTDGRISYGYLGRTNSCFLFFSTVFIVFIACMRASVCMIVCQLLTNKDSYRNACGHHPACRFCYTLRCTCFMYSCQP